MAEINGETFEIIDFTCPECDVKYENVHRGKVPRGFYNQFIFTNKCCARYYTKDGQDVTYEYLKSKGIQFS